jgi:hypothetical protein
MFVSARCRLDDPAHVTHPRPAARVQRRRARRLIEAHHLRHVLPRLRVRGHAAILRDRLLAGVVRGDGEPHVVAEALHQRPQMARPTVDVLPGVERIPHP